MNETMTVVEEVSNPTNGPGATGMAPVDTSLSFKEEDFAADIAKMAETASQPTKPAQPEQAAITPEEEAKPEVSVPDKFKTPDGGIDEAKVAKSMTNAEEMLGKYLQMEKDLKRKMNEVKAKENPYLAPPVPQTPAPSIPVNTDFAKRLEDDLAKEGAGVVLAKLFTAAQESALEQARAEVNAVRGQTEALTTKAQIEAIAKTDPWVYTEEGVTTLNKILSEQPYLMSAPDPYKAAYLQYAGRKSIASRSVSQVSTPTPTARPSAPIPTGQAAAPTSAPVIRLDSRAAIDQHLKKLTPQQQSEFFKKQGFPGFDR